MGYNGGSTYYKGLNSSRYRYSSGGWLKDVQGVPKYGSVW